MRHILGIDNFSAANYSLIFRLNRENKVGKGSFINDVRRFLTIIDPPTPPNVRFLPYKRPIFWVILDPPTPPKIGHH